MRVVVGKAQVKANLQYPPRDLELYFDRLVVAGGDHVNRQAGQGFAQQVGAFFLDLDDIAKVVQVVKGAVLALAAVAVLLDTMN